MTATASVSSPWIPEDDLLLKNSIEGGASLEALAKGAIKFSRKFTFRELRDRWYSLLYDPDVSAQASARMAELELSVSNSSSKSKLDNTKGSEKVPEKRSIRRHYYAMRKRIKNEFFSSPNLGFFHQEHNATSNHRTHDDNVLLEDCLANNLGFEEKDFEILRQAFPESIGTVATNVINGAMREEGLFKFTEDVSPSQNELIGGSFDPKLEMKNATRIDDSGPSESQPKSDKSGGFGGKHLFNSPMSDGSASFHTLGFSSPSTRLPLWKTLEDVSAPDMPVDENNAESHQVAEETEEYDHQREGKSSPGYDGAHQMSLSGQDGEYTDLPESLLNFSNEDDILFMDADVKDSTHDDIAKNVHTDATVSIQCPEELKDYQQQEGDVASTSVSQLDFIICTLNTEDPDIPCNDDIFLLIHPSTQITPSVGLQIATDNVGSLSSSSNEKDNEHGPSSVKKGKDPAPCFSRSHSSRPNASHVGSGPKNESPEGEYLAPKPNNIRLPNQTRPVHRALEMSGNELIEEDASKVELRGSCIPMVYNEIPLPLEGGSVKRVDPEPMDDSYIDDVDNSDSDGDVPYFSDVEAMILEMDLAHSQDSCITSEVARYQNEDAKRMIMRLEQAARSSFQRAMSTHGALAIFYGRHLKEYMKKIEVTIGRSTDDTEVDIDLRKEGRANKISRRQAIIKMDTDGSFSLKNLGASSISLNGKLVAQGQMVTLGSSCLIEIRGMSFVFEINEKYVRRFLSNKPR
ncbi:uncharacterized protein [Rutidosis leptorrhynchoides]|uniref:uncharacterized protein n=1 Tax=Rutidosis leptorrhynchoides TaxID=125765 RepID=UPI003A992FC9